jgi:hypothetical protein
MALIMGLGWLFPKRSSSSSSSSEAVIFVDSAKEWVQSGLDRCESKSHMADSKLQSAHIPVAASSTSTWEGWYVDTYDRQKHRMPSFRMTAHPKSAALTEESVPTMCLSGSGQDDEGSYTITGLYSPGSQRVAISKFYDASRDNAIEYRGTLNSNGKQLDGKWKLVDRSGSAWSEIFHWRCVSGPGFVGSQ